jgi:hypothetical protein
MQLLRLLTAHDLRGWPGLRRPVAEALINRQPRTVIEALHIRGVGRKTTKRLLARGLLMDPEGVQRRTPDGITISKT